MHIVVVAIVLMVFLVILAVMLVCAIIGGAAFGALKLFKVPDPMPAVGGIATGIIVAVALLSNYETLASLGPTDTLGSRKSISQLEPEPITPTHYAKAETLLKNSNGSIAGGNVLSIGQCVEVVGALRGSTTRLRTDNGTYLVDGGGLAPLKDEQKCPVEILEAQKPDFLRANGNVGLRNSANHDYRFTGVNVKEGQCLEILAYKERNFVLVKVDSAVGYISLKALGGKC